MMKGERHGDQTEEVNEEESDNIFVGDRLKASILKVPASIDMFWRRNYWCCISPCVPHFRPGGQSNPLSNLAQVYDLMNITRSPEIERGRWKL